MFAYKVTENVWVTRSSSQQRPVFVVIEGASKTEVEFMKAVEKFGIWKVHWEKQYLERVAKLAVV